MRSQHWLGPAPKTKKKEINKLFIALYRNTTKLHRRNINYENVMSYLYLTKNKTKTKKYFNQIEMSVKKQLRKMIKTNAMK